MKNTATNNAPIATEKVTSKSWLTTIEKKVMPAQLKPNKKLIRFLKENN